MKNSVGLPIQSFPMEVQVALMELDEQGNGIIEPSELVNMLQQHKRLMDAAKQNALDLSCLPPDVQEACKAFDADGSGNVQVAELAQAAKMYQSSKERGRKLTKVILLLALLVVLLLLSITGLTYAVVEFSKETQYEGDIMKVKGTDDVIRVKSADTFLQPSTGGSTSSMTDEEGKEITVPAASTDFPLKYDLPFELFSRLKQVKVKEPAYSAIADVTGIFKTASQIVVSTDLFNIRLLSKPSLTVVELLDDELVDESSPLGMAASRLRSLLGLRNNGRHLLQSTNQVSVKIADEVAPDSEGGGAAVKWTVHPYVGCRGKQMTQLKNSDGEVFLELSSPRFWSPANEGLTIEDCKERCARDPTCEAVETFGRVGTETCTFKKGVYIGQGQPTNEDALSNCYTMDDRAKISSRTCAYGDSKASWAELDGFSWSHKGSFMRVTEEMEEIEEGRYEKYLKLVELPTRKIHDDANDEYACATKCAEDEECAGFTINYETQPRCATYAEADLEDEYMVNSRDLMVQETENSGGNIHSWSKVCLNKDPKGPEPPVHVEIMKRSKCSNLIRLDGNDLYYPQLYSPDTLTSHTDCKRAVMNQLGKKCAYPAQFGWEKNWNFRSVEISGCYCVPRGQKCVPESAGRLWSRYFMDALKEDDDAGDWLEEHEEKGALSTTPIPDESRIKLVAVDQVCMNVKSLRTAEERETTGKLLSLDQCMQRAMADPDCISHGPTIQFHDYSSFDNKPEVVSLGLNRIHNSRQSGHNGHPHADNFLDYDCACSTDCTMDTMDIQTPGMLAIESTPGVRSARGTCTGEIRGINTLSDRAKLISEGYLEEGNLYGEFSSKYWALSSNPYKVRAMPVAVSPQEVVHPGETRNDLAWFYPDGRSLARSARSFMVDNFEYEQGSCMNENFRYSLTESDIKENNKNRAGHTNIYTIAPGEDDLCIDEGKTDADGNRTWTIPAGRYKCITPSPDDWCSNEGEVHQYTHTCGRVCHDYYGKRGVKKNDSWGRDVACDACSEAGGLFGWMGCPALVAVGEDCLGACDDQKGPCPRCQGEIGMGGWCCRHGSHSASGCDGMMGIEGLESHVCVPAPSKENIPELCLANMAYLDGPMCSTVYNVSPSECRKACEADECCNYWDHEIDNSICRLRSNGGSGAKPIDNFAAGSQDCAGLCLVNMAYHDGPMCSTVYNASPSECRKACEADACCNYWDLDINNSICRLRSNKGGGANPEANFAAGIQDCIGL